MVHHKGKLKQIQISFQSLEVFTTLRAEAINTLRRRAGYLPTQGFLTIKQAQGVSLKPGLTIQA